MIEKVVSIMRNKGQAKGIAMPIVYENIAESHEAYQRNFLVDGKISPIVQSDPQRIMQIIIGLVSNALKFTSDGHVKTLVRILENE